MTREGISACVHSASRLKSRSQASAPALRTQTQQITRTGPRKSALHRNLYTHTVSPMSVEPKLSDMERIDAIRSGDTDAYETLMNEFQGPVLAFVIRMIGDAHEAEDIAQNVFVRAYGALQAPRFELRNATLSTWLFQIARNAAIDHLRKRNRKPFLSLELFPGMRDDMPDNQPRPDDQIATQELQDRIRHVLQQLPEDQRTALVLSVYHQQTHEQIAAVLKCSTKSVESRIYRARKKLATWLL
jgi:RNA polymerase sigma-70 factor, ECF subfamily